MAVRTLLQGCYELIEMDDDGNPSGDDTAVDTARAPPPVDASAHAPNVTNDGAVKIVRTEDNGVIVDELKALCAAASLRLIPGLAAALQVDVQEREWKERPVTRVVNLLKDMQAELQKEADNDEELYDNLVCWCETNEKGKTVSIDDAEAHITDLTATIEELTATSARLRSEEHTSELQSP